MKVFEYTAKDQAGHKFTGTYDNVENVAMLRDELGKMGYVLVRAHPTTGGDVGSKRLKVSGSEIVSFTYKFSEMYSAGLSIIRCLEMLEQQTQNRDFKYIISDIR